MNTIINTINTNDNLFSGARPGRRRAVSGALASIIFLLSMFFFVSMNANAEVPDASSVYYLSPNNDGVQDSLVIPLVIKDTRYIAAWHFTVTDENGKTVYSEGSDAEKIDISAKNWKKILANFFKSKESVNVPDKIVWGGTDSSGKVLSDGTYNFYIDAKDDNENYSRTPVYKVVIDTVPPKVSVAQPGSKYFGTGNNTTFTITQSGSTEDKWTGVIKDSKGTVVRTYEWFNSEPKTFLWDGKDDSGFTVPEGDYSYSVSAVDAAGNKSNPAGIEGIHFERRPVEVEIGRTVAQLAPLGKTKIQTFNIKTTVRDKVQSWSFAIVPAAPEGGKTGKTPPAIFTQSGKSDLPATIKWDGIDNTTNAIAEGSFKGVLNVNLLSGTPFASAETPSFLCTGQPPSLKVTTSPALFSPGSDNENDILTIKLAAKSVLPLQSWSFVIYEPISNEVFWTKSGISELPDQLQWDGKSNNGELVQSAMSYPYKFTATDTQGQVARPAEGQIKTDVLVIRDGNQLKIRLPSIIFRANHADFVSVAEDKKRGLSQTQIDENNRILTRVAEILQKFRDYKVKVEGHANSETGTEKEEVEELIPLSQDRAKFVKDWLVAHGISPARLSTEGLGGRFPVMKNRKDRANWWKNRRVEFVLEK